MNKKLLAVAIASAIAAPLAAQADDGNVTLYGQANAAIESTDHDGTGTAGNRTNVASNSSRLGVKGWESIGNGLKAVFLMEAAVGLDNGNGGSGSLFGGGRDGYVGLAGNFGTVALGFHGQPYKTSTNGLDIFGDTIADYSAIMNGNGTYDSGIGNAVIWFLPNLNGFSGHLQYGFDETAGSEADKWGAQFNYSNGPLYVTYARADVESTTANADTQADKVGASYTFGGATTVSAIYENLDAGSAASNALDRDAWYLALSHKMGNNTFKLAYAATDDARASTDSGANYWAVGLSHHFSKRTELYGLYTQLSNDTNSTYGLGNTGSSNATGAVGAGQDPSSFAIGMKHSF